MTASLKSHSHGQTMVLTISNPEHRNALGPDMYAAGVEALNVAGAWQLLRKHNISILPVTDTEQQLLGVVSTTDFLKNLQVPHYWGLLRHVNQLLLKRKHSSQYQRSVADIMASHVTVAQQDDHIAALVPMLSDQGRHHIPVLNAQQQLVGVITQSDLIAALFKTKLA